MAASHPTLFNRSVYLYDEGYYDSFKRATDEKILTGLIQGRLNAAFVRQGLVFQEDETRVFDMGSGPCDTSLLHYLPSGFTSKKVVVRAVDENARYVGGKDLATGEEIPYSVCDAYRNFLWAQKAFVTRGIALDFRSSQGDAFNGQSVTNVSVDGDVKLNSFDLALLSHLFYHVAPKDGLTSRQRLDNALKDVAENVLTQEGVAVAYHVAIGGPDDNCSFQYFRDNFGSRSEHAERQSNTDAMDTTDPATQIEQSCAKQGITCRTLPFLTKLRFSKGLFASNDTRTLFKNPARYEELLQTPALYEDLKQIYFIVQRSANELAEDSGETGLANYVDKILDAIQATADEDGHYLVTHEKMQLITHPDRTAETQAKVDTALREVEAGMGALYGAATGEFLAR